ncbi:MAG TPA: enolase C-terminal domain-like protein [Chthoniobacteraceae bacterium]|nr:enolase C-terminal domain-like protein [Chthoniobacteraceae bacterium]
MKIETTRLDLARQPMKKAFGFKGAAYHEKWIASVTLTTPEGQSATGHGGLAVLWSDERVFLNHTETGGNIMMLAVLERVLTRVRGCTFASAPELLDTVLPEAEALARTITGQPEVRRTFALNALVALDEAAWKLTALTRGVSDFDTLVPKPLRPALAHRHRELEIVPLISYEVTPQEIIQLAREGHRVLKIKIGATGSPGEMLARDQARLSQVHQALSQSGIAPDAFPLYLDANLRYTTRAAIEALLDHAAALGLRVMILEEPFAEGTEIDVHGLDVLVAADESLHCVEDVAAKAALGYRAAALKPAGKTLSQTLRMAAEAHRLGLHTFVADNTCTPQLADINRNIAARLAPLPGLSCGLMEINGPQSYRNWERLLAAHPFARASWMTLQNGHIPLDAAFYRDAGGWLSADCIRPSP